MSNKLDNNIIKYKFNFFKIFLIKGINGDILIDTGFLTTRNKVKKICEKNNVKLIILTHAHIDHVFNAAYLKRKFKCKIAIGINDLKNLDNSIINSVPVNNKYKYRTKLMNFFMKHIQKEDFKPDILLHNNEELNRYGISLKIIDLPGHTNGSIGIMYNNNLFVGDALVNRKKYIELSYQMQNRQLAFESALKIVDLNPQTIYIGHEKNFGCDLLKKSIPFIEKQVGKS